MILTDEGEALKQLVCFIYLFIDHEGEQCVLKVKMFTPFKINTNNILCIFNNK